MLDLFSGGAFSKFSIFAMSITPYINAAIIIQLLNVVIPTLEQWSKEGEEGHKKTTQVTRYLTVVLAFLQAIGMSIEPSRKRVGPAALGLMSNSKMSVGNHSVAHALGMSTTPLMCPCTGAEPSNE